MIAIAASAAQIPALYLSHSRVAWLVTGVTGFVFLLGLRRRLLVRKRSVVVGVGVLLVLMASATRSAQDIPLGQALGGRIWIWEHSARAAASGCWR